MKNLDGGDSGVDSLSSYRRGQGKQWVRPPEGGQLAGRRRRDCLESGLDPVTIVVQVFRPFQVSRVEPPSFDEFLKTILRSGLFNAAEFEAVRQAAPADALTDAKSLANYLVRIGKLSRFQASKLLEGVTLGLVLGSFHVLAPIGKGGMGAVYLARDSRTQRLIALKVLPPKRAKAQERLLIRFRREMEIS